MSAPATQNLWAVNTAKHRFGKGWWTLSAGTGFAAILLLFLPGRKRYRAALGLGLVCVLSFTLGCNGGYGGGGGNKATTTTTISVTTSTKAALNANIAFSISVTSTGTAANGLVQLFDGVNSLGPATYVVNGALTINNSGLALGTHAISAQYMGDTNTKASNSGALNVTITGTTPPVTITGTSGSTTATNTMTITIN